MKNKRYTILGCDSIADTENHWQILYADLGEQTAWLLVEALNDNESLMADVQELTVSLNSCNKAIEHVTNPTDDQIDSLLAQLDPKLVTGTIGALFMDESREIIRLWLSTLKPEEIGDRK